MASDHEEPSRPRSRLARLNRSGFVAAALAMTLSAVGLLASPGEAAATSGHPGGELLAVSCVNRNGCMAVGYHFGYAGYKYPQTFAEWWNGSRWTALLTPTVSGQGTSGELSGVDCLSSHDCVAVGVFNQVMVERWNGRHWSAKTLDLYPGRGVPAISCTGPKACMIVGATYYRDAFAWWNGRSWRTGNTKKASPAYQLNGVSCASTTSCTAVGWSQASFADEPKTLVERWNGASWTIEPSPDTKGRSTDDQLNAVSCSSRTVCTAVGGYATRLGGANFMHHTLAELRTTSGWTISDTPTLPHSENTATLAFTAASANCNVYCMAVGENATLRRSKALADSWNARTRRWTVRPPVQPAGAEKVALQGVSCENAISCMAVGYYTTSAYPDGLTLSETWSGSRWTTRRTTSAG